MNTKCEANWYAREFTWSELTRWALPAVWDNEQRWLLPRPTAERTWPRNFDLPERNPMDHLQLTRLLRVFYCTYALQTNTNLSLWQLKYKSNRILSGLFSVSEARRSVSTERTISHYSQIIENSAWNRISFAIIPRDRNHLANYLSIMTAHFFPVTSLLNLFPNFRIPLTVLPFKPELR